MVRFLIRILALGAMCAPAAAAGPATTERADPSLPMRFEWHTEGPAEQCGTTCRTWISAVGFIASDTAREFETFAKTNNVEGATLAIDSEGGSVTGALALGRAIRRFNMTTTIGQTIPLPSEDGTARAILSPNVSCESMCAFVMLGGARRYVPPEAQVLVHMIWLGNKRSHSQEQNYTADELGLVQQDIGSIARYTIEMGGNIELLETALQIPPWKPMYVLTRDEVQRTRLTTLASGADLPVGSPPPSPAIANAKPLTGVTQTLGGGN